MGGFFIGAQAMILAVWLLIALVVGAVFGIAGAAYLAYHPVKMPW